MVDLTPTNQQAAAEAGGAVTSKQPTTSVSPGQVAAPANELAGALDKGANVLMNDVAVPLAKQAAADDLLKQKITRNADGTVTVENPASSPLLFGDAAVAYKDAVTSGTIAQHANDISQKFAEMHAQFPTDPQGFKAASNAYLDQRKKDLTGPMGEAVQREGAQLQTQHFNSITNTSTTIDVENQKKSILAQIDDQNNTRIALARQGGTDTDEFKQATAKANHSYDALVSNPLFKTPQDQVDLEKKNSAALMQGEALNAQMDATFKTPNGKALAQQQLVDHVLNNPDLREIDRTRLYSQGMARLAYLSGDMKERVDANKKVIEEAEGALASGALKPEDPAVGMMIQNAYNIGDGEGAKRLTAAVTVRQQTHQFDVLPDAIKAEVLGVPGPAGNSPVNQSIPPEGRALLKTIGSTESANRYDIRYGDNRFHDFTDHPRIDAPITSGPDVGKTSSAAGYYQFIAPTWDQLKNKLGLKDFSPANQDTAAWDLAQTTYKEKTGKDLLTVLKSGDTSDVLPSLSRQWSSLPGGRQPAGRFMSPSANGGPGFTAEQAQSNPFLLSSYVRTLAADRALRNQSAKQSAEAAGKGLDHGLLPSPSIVAEVNQAAALDPARMQPVADELNGRLNGAATAALPQEQRAQLLQTYKDATQGQDQHHLNLAAGALSQVQKQETNMREHPFDEGARRGWTPPAAPIDPAHPDTIAAALVQRKALADRIGSLNHTPPPPLLDKDEMPKLQAGLQGQQAPAILGSIAQSLKPDEMQALLKEEGFRTSITGMSRSGDPAKMNAAYSFMDAQQKQNPLQFETQFKDGLRDLRTWQALGAFYSPDAVSKMMLKSNDPDQSAAREASDKVAKTALEAVSADAVVSKFSTGWGPFGTGARAPVSFDGGDAKGALKADYDLNYKEGFASSHDATMADKFAMEKLNLKYAVSPTNGNKVTAYAPERYYPLVGGSYDWMAKQLDDAVAVHGGVATAGGAYDKNVPAGELYGTVAPDAVFGNETRGERQYGALRALVSDEKTASEAAFYDKTKPASETNKPPSYQIILQEPNGRFGLMTNPAGGAVRRFRFDPSAPFAERASGMEARRAAIPAAFNGPQP